MRRYHLGPTLLGTFALALASICAPAAEVPPAHASAVLIELFTSEGCSDCPPADELLRQVSGRQTEYGQLIVGISEHVSYWNDLGWKDPFSADQYTQRQNDYGAHFRLDSVYTPQMVVNGREQFVGSDRRALASAFASEARRKQIQLHITSLQVTEKNLTFRYSAMGLPKSGSLELVAVLVDDMERSNVLRGENSGHEIIHASVARALARVGALRETEQKSVTLPLPQSLDAHSGHHLVLFAQQNGTGPVLGVDAKPF